MKFTLASFYTQNAFLRGSWIKEINTKSICDIMPKNSVYVPKISFAVAK